MAERTNGVNLSWKQIVAVLLLGSGGAALTSFAVNKNTAPIADSVTAREFEMLRDEVRSVRTLVESAIRSLPR